MPHRSRKNKSRSKAPPVPTFALYGERGAPGVDLLHIEEVQSRSRLYRWEISAHVHHGLYQVIWLREGSARAALDELRQKVAAPAALVVPPSVVHGFRFAPDSQGYVLTFSPRWLVEGDRAAVADPFRRLFEAPRVLHLDADTLDAQRLDGLLRELAAEFNASAPDAPIPGWLARAVVWRLAQICARLDEPGRAGRAHRALFTRFVLLVEAHLLEHWPVARYAARLGLTVERLNRLARAEVSKSALEYIHDRLTREASRRLIYIAAPISQLAFELGFEDPAYFCRFFKRRTGLNPSRYRQAHEVGS
jgi:AraC family transcriptional activator of pobA